VKVPTVCAEYDRASVKYPAEAQKVGCGGFVGARPSAFLMSGVPPRQMVRLKSCPDTSCLCRRVFSQLVEPNQRRPGLPQSLEGALFIVKWRRTGAPPAYIDSGSTMDLSWGIRCNTLGRSRHAFPLAKERAKGIPRLATCFDLHR
jgi:hypothetical protein